MNDNLTDEEIGFQLERIKEQHPGLDEMTLYNEGAILDIYADGEEIFLEDVEDIFYTIVRKHSLKLLSSPFTIVLDLMDFMYNVVE